MSTFDTIRMQLRRKRYEVTRATELVEYESDSTQLAGTLTQPSDQIKQIDETLERIEYLERMEYGLCVACGEPIDVEDLQRDPDAVLCPSCCS